MTILYGSLVGTPQQALNLIPTSNFCQKGSDHILIRDTVLFTAANVIGDQVFLGKFKSGTLISPPGTLFNDAFGAGVKLNIGDATYPTGLANQIDISGASAPSVPLVKSFTAAKMGQPLWQLLGYAADPKTTIALYGTLAGAAPAQNANLAWQLVGIER